MPTIRLLLLTLISRRRAGSLARHLTNGTVRMNLRATYDRDFPGPTADRRHIECFGSPMTGRFCRWRRNSRCGWRINGDATVRTTGCERRKSGNYNYSYCICGYPGRASSDRSDRASSWRRLARRIRPAPRRRFAAARQRLPLGFTTCGCQRLTRIRLPLGKS